MIGNDDFDLRFGKKVNDILCSAIDLSMSPLTPKTPDLAYRHVLNAQGDELFFHRVHLEGLNHCFNLFHQPISSSDGSGPFPVLNPLLFSPWTLTPGAVCRRR